ncbi:macro domain-containing protein [Tissierella creatinini]|nr:macro domain-containing protein [Tissierella creatinini]TJX64177.1 macro domain-containing protein [Soehngenia saccharolytica]
MPLEIIRNDITQVHADAIVNAASPDLLGGSGVDGRIHEVAGKELLEECKSLGGCQVGQAKITKAYKLPAKYVIHTVGPVWQGGNHNEERLLKECYKNSLLLAKKYNLESIAFPLIASGTFGYPKDKALKTAIATIGEFLLDNEILVYLVVYDKKAFKLSKNLFTSIKQYIDDNYVEEKTPGRDEIRTYYQLKEFKLEETVELLNESLQSSAKYKRNLKDVVNNIDETFSQMLLRLIDEKGMTDAETYKKANIDRKLFSKIRNNIDYSPSKSTVLAFAVALSLSLDEAKDLLLKAGFALSNSNKFDIIIQFFIENENYDIFEINEALFAFNQNLLGL